MMVRRQGMKLNSPKRLSFAALTLSFIGLPLAIPQLIHSPTFPETKVHAFSWGNGMHTTQRTSFSRSWWYYVRSSQSACAVSSLSRS